MSIPAFTKKYFVPYQVYGGAKREIQIFANGFSGDPIEWKGGSTPWKIEKGSTDDLFDGLIVSSVATIEVLLEERFDFSEFIESRQSHLVNLVDMDTDTVMWSGWVEPHNGNSPYSRPPHKLTFKASCGLAQLKRIKWQQSVSEPIKKSVIEIIGRCLLLTGHALNLNTSVFSHEQVMPTGDPLAGYRLNTNRYYDGTERLYAYDILSDILEKHNAEIFQERNEWVIRSLPDQTRGYTDKRRYSPAGGSLGTVAQNLLYRINTEKALSLSTGSRSALRPIKKWTASANLLPYTNPFDNGDLRGWDGTTFPGWNLAPMVGFWSKHDTGNPKTPYAIKITGLTFMDQIIRMKRNFWGRLRVTKVEPSRFISPNPLEFNPQEEKTVITIPYRVEARQNPDAVTFIIGVYTQRANGSDKIWLQEDGKWGKDWDVIYFKGASSLVDKEPTEGRIEVDTKSLNVVKNWVPSSQLPSPYQFLYVKIYQLIAPPGYPGSDTVELKLYGIYINKTDTVMGGPTSVSYTLNNKSTVEDDSRGVQLLTAELHGTHLTGIPLDLNQEANTAQWSRPGFTDERKSLLGLMVSERLAMTTPALKVMTCDIAVLPDQSEPLFENFLIFDDAGEERFKIVRYSYIDHSRTASVTAVELKYDVPGNVTGISVVGGKVSYDNTGNGEVSEGIESSTGTGTKPVEEGVEEEKAVLDSENILIDFIVAEENEEEIDIVEILGIDEEYLEDLIFSVISKPSWVKIEMQDDGRWTVSGIPPSSGSHTIVYTITDSADTVSTGKVIISVEPSEDFIESWPPVFVDLPTLIFEKGIESTQVYDIFDYLDTEGDHTGVGLSPKLLSKPNWITDSSIVFGLISATGKPLALGSELITYEISDVIGRTTNVPFPVKVVEPIKMVHELVGIGEIPGSYELPEEFEVQSTIEADFDRWEATLKGGGDLGDEIDESWTDSDPLPTFTSDAGQFVYEIILYRLDVPIKTDTVKFVLYDEEYLAKAKAFLTVSNASVGEITPDGLTIFDYHELCNVLIEIEDVEHDKATVTMSSQNRTFELPEPKTEGSYNLYSADHAIGEGVYTITVVLELEDNGVLKREYTFEIGSQEPKPEAGFKLISYTPGTSNYSVVQDLPIDGGIIQIPAAYGVLFEPDIEISSFEWEMYKLEDGAFAPLQLSVQKITGNTEKILIFDGKKSNQIDGAHDPNGRFRIDGIARDASGKILQLVKADWRFRVATAPGDGSGLDLHHTNTDGSNQPLIDSNIPKEGYTVEVPVAPMRWQIRFTHFPGNEGFDELKSYFIKNDSIFFKGINNDGISSFEDRVYPEPVVEIPRLSTFGWSQPNGDYVGYMHPTGTSSINEPGQYEFRVEGYLAGVKVAETYSKFTLIESVPNPPIKDCCCDGEGEIGDYDPWEEKQW